MTTKQIYLWAGAILALALLAVAVMLFGRPYYMEVPKVPSTPVTTFTGNYGKIDLNKSTVHGKAGEFIPAVLTIYPENNVAVTNLYWPMNTVGMFMPLHWEFPVNEGAQSKNIGLTIMTSTPAGTYIFLQKVEFRVNHVGNPTTTESFEIPLTLIVEE